MVMHDEQEPPRNFGRSPLRGSFRSLVLGWTDPQTGERLTCSGDASEGMLDELEPLGFEVLSGDARGTPAAPGTDGGAAVRRLTLRARLTQAPDGRLSREGA